MCCPTETHPFTNRWFDFNKTTLTPEAREAWVVNDEKGYFGFLPNQQIKHLIIGSFPIWQSVHHNPPHDRFEFAFFYCSRLNGFFSFMETLSGYNFFPTTRQTPAQKVQSIADFFVSKQLGITDILRQVKRTDADCQSSADNHLEAIQYNNLRELLRNYPDLTNIYFTSRNVETWFRQYLRPHRLGRNIQASVLFSPSPASNVAAAGILNRDERNQGPNYTLRFHLKHIPLVNTLDGGDQLKVGKWAERLRGVPDLVRPEILAHPNFKAIQNRL